MRIVSNLTVRGSGEAIWAERFDYKIDDSFDAQELIAREVVTAVQVTLTEGDQAQFWRKGTTNVMAATTMMARMVMPVRAITATIPIPPATNGPSYYAPSYGVGFTCYGGDDGDHWHHWGSHDWRWHSNGSGRNQWHWSNENNLRRD